MLRFELCDTSIVEVELHVQERVWFGEGGVGKDEWDKTEKLDRLYLATVRSLTLGFDKLLTKLFKLFILVNLIHAVNRV